MRDHGMIGSAASLGTGGHACWGFDRQAEFTDAALEFLEAGRRRGQRLGYLGDGPVEEHRERLAGLGDVGRLIDTGALRLFSLEDLYPVGEPVDTEAQLAVYAAATDAALRDGYSGLRVAAEVTGLVAEPSGWEAHVRWESVADRYMAGRPLEALCGYDRGAIPAELLGDLAAVHPAANEAASVAPFHLFAADPDTLALQGEVDMFSATALDRLLGLAFGGGAPRTLDLGELEFIDHHGFLALVGHAERLAADGGLSIERRPHLVERLCELFDLSL